jgi:hypothetical protein
MVFVVTYVCRLNSSGKGWQKLLGRRHLAAIATSEERKVTSEKIASHFEQQLDNIYATQAKSTHDIFNNALGNVKQAV